MNWIICTQRQVTQKNVVLRVFIDIFDRNDIYGYSTNSGVDLSKYQGSKQFPE